MSPRSDEQRSFGHDQKKEKILTSGLLSKYRDNVYSSDIKLSIYNKGRRQKTNKHGKT